MDELTVPLDDTSLTLLREALDACVDEDGTVVGGEFTLSKLLHFWSGYDPTKETYEDDTAVYDHPTLHYTDVIRALIDELRATRAGHDYREESHAD